MTLICVLALCSGGATAQSMADVEHAARAKDYKGERSILSVLAASGNPEAQRKLGEMHYEGKGGSRDVDLAVKWLYEAAKRNDAIAEYDLGYLYERGDGVPKDTSSALQWYGRSALRGYAEAQYALGRIYSTSGPNENLTLAEEWLTEAAKQGHSAAATNLPAVRSRKQAFYETYFRPDVERERAKLAAEEQERVAKAERIEQERLQDEERRAQRRERDQQERQAKADNDRDLQNTLDTIRATGAATSASIAQTTRLTQQRQQQTQSGSSASACQSRCPAPSTTSQRALYEQAACVCQCMGNSQCYEKNMASARSVSGAPYSWSSDFGKSYAPINKPTSTYSPPVSNCPAGQICAGRGD